MDGSGVSSSVGMVQRRIGLGTTGDTYEDHRSPNIVSRELKMITSSTSPKTHEIGVLFWCGIQTRSSSTSSCNMFPIPVCTQCDTLDWRHLAARPGCGLLSSCCYISGNGRTLPDSLGGGSVSEPSVPILSRTVSVDRCIGLAVENRSKRLDPNRSLPAHRITSASHARPSVRQPEFDSLLAMRFASSPIHNVPIRSIATRDIPSGDVKSIFVFLIRQGIRMADSDHKVVFRARPANKKP